MGVGLEPCANNFDLIYLTTNLTMSHSAINIDCNVTKNYCIMSDEEQIWPPPEGLIVKFNSEDHAMAGFITQTCLPESKAHLKHLS